VAQKKIYPSLISADILDLRTVIKKLESVCDGFHIDVMDFHYVPNLTWGSAFINAIANEAQKQLWVHLMVEQPVDFMTTVHLRAGDILSFHVETIKNLQSFINDLQKKKIIPSIAISPKNDLEEMYPFLDKIPHVLLMSVEPGFSGQSFLQSSIDRLKSLIAYREKQKLSFRIGMDGGINTNNIEQLAKSGCDDFAIASGIFKTDDIVGACKELRKLTRA
jgi:ribulose-phosphate 3-epimerase